MVLLGIVVVLFGLLFGFLSWWFLGLTLDAGTDTEHRLSVDSLPRHLHSLAVEYERLGYGPATATIVGQGSPLPRFRVLMTNPSRLFDLQVTSAAKGRLGVCLVTYYPGGAFTTSNTAGEAIAPGWVTQSQFSQSLKVLVDTHLRAMEALRELGCVPLDQEPSEILQRLEVERRDELATLSSVFGRIRAVKAMWRSILHLPAVRAPIHGRHLRRTARRLGRPARPAD